MSSKKLIIKGTKTQKVLLALEVLVVIFMLAFAVIGKHYAKISDDIISRVNSICVFLTIALSFIISSKAVSGENDEEENKDNK